MNIFHSAIKDKFFIIKINKCSWTPHDVLNYFVHSFSSTKPMNGPQSFHDFMKTREAPYIKNNLEAIIRSIEVVSRRDTSCQEDPYISLTINKSGKYCKTGEVQLCYFKLENPATFEEEINHITRAYTSISK